MLGTRLFGRTREEAEIRRLLDAARRGEGGTLVIRGDPGIGKSALLDRAAALGDGMMVLRTAGVDDEADLAFAGLHGLVRPIVSKLGELVETHSRALAGALGLAPSQDSDRFLVSVAVLDLLAAAAEDQPVLCLIDDAQWLDRPSADALVFAARRVRAERLTLLFGARDGDLRPFGAAGLPEIVLAGVDDESALAILDARAHEAVANVRVRLLAEAAGNPLALLELPSGLTAAQLGGLEPLPDAMPLTRRLQAVFRQRIERMPGVTQLALLIAAADDTGLVSTVLRAATSLKISSDALEPAESSGLIRADGGTIVFRHPLVRSALYEASPLSQRQRVHAALAGALAGDEHADRRVWHQSMAALTGDEEVASALEASGRRAQRRAGHASAATAFQRAADLTLEESRRAPRLALAAQAAWDAGRPDWARELIARLLPSADETLRARMLYLRGVIEARSGDMRGATATLLEAADASSEPSLTLEILAEATQAAGDGDPAQAAAFGARARETQAGTKREEFIRCVSIGFAMLFGGEFDAAHLIFHDALELATGLNDDPRAQIWAANASLVGVDLGTGLTYATRAVQLARNRGLLSLLPIALEQQGIELFWQNRFEEAYSAATEGYGLAVDLGQRREWHLTTLACVEAVWGRETDAREHAVLGTALAQRRGETFLTTTAQAAIGLLDLARGRPDLAADALVAIAEGGPGINPIIAMASVPDAVEAIVRAGRSHDVVKTPLDRYRVWCAHMPTDGDKSLLARCDALLTVRPPGEAFRESVELGPSLPPFQRARSELLYGEWLRRERQRTEARIHLRAAIEPFRALGAVLWTQRAENELRASGEVARKRDFSTRDQLTPQELQIAGLVTEGLANREIAAQLFLSPRTVEYHLGKVFSKLGIASRMELIRHGLRGRNL